MIEIKVLWAWVHAQIGTLRERREEQGNDAGFTTLEWVAIAGVVIVAAIVVATVLMNKAKDGANNVNVQ